MRTIYTVLVFGLLVTGVASGQTSHGAEVATAPVALPNAVDVRVQGLDAPLKFQNIEKPSWLQADTLTAIISLLIALLALKLSLKQWREQRQTVQMEMCERMFGELRRTELEFKTPIDDEYQQDPQKWDPAWIRAQSKKIEYAAHDHFSRWDHLAYLVIERRIDDAAMCELIRRKLTYAYESQLTEYAPDWKTENGKFPYFKELYGTYKPART